ncbi:hypothetical protein KAU08_00750, partial [bacterium]|nr:hypothetical protein [bacterium]
VMWINSLFKILLSLFTEFRPHLAHLLLMPISPLLMWGPVTHLYLNKRALDKINPDEIEDENTREILLDENLRKIFINGGNSVDLIKANDLRNRERCFEYAHNTIPNYFTGDPVMGRYLLEEIEKSGNDPMKRAWAFGWLAHQVSDGFAHKIPHSGCEGWVNSRRVLAGCYRPETGDESVSIAAARIQLYVADHWLAEMLTDSLCYSRERDFIDSFKIDLSIPTKDEVFTASKRILLGFEKQLGPGFVYFEPLSEDKLREIVTYNHLIILCSLDVYRAILKAYPGLDFEKYIARSPRMSRLDELLDNSINAIVKMLKNPKDPWNPDDWLPDGGNNFKFSVYEYERIWRPGRFTFGRKFGLLGWIYYNKSTDRLIDWVRDLAATYDFWPLMKFGISVLYGRGKSQWPIAGTFIRKLINEKPSSVQNTMASVAKHCRLEKYEEIIPD